MNLKKLFFLIFSLLIIIGGVLGFNIYSRIYTANTTKEGYLYIPTNSNFNEVKSLVRPFLKRVKPFIWVAKKKKYPNAVKPGKYLISKGMNNNQLVNLLRSGKQTFVKLTFNNQDSFKQLAGRVAQQIEADSISLLNAFNDDVFLKENGFNKNNAISMYIPNTYEFYWDTSAKEFRNRMLKEYHKFWNISRIKKAKELGLTKNEVITLASIVQKETAIVSERPMVAKLYLNRLRDKWPLQADPTIIFALKEKLGSAIIIKRVLTKDLEINSPYNTYKNIGLPPGPIAMPDISSIDAVLNPANHQYYYMCASINTIGKHEFAKTLSQHNRNATKYQSWLNKQGVNR
ncbi:aminodeoxychorismate lyase [Lutibacter profundi]|uniref:Endolytic murein transglycosylase n=1 Tax=Lutibacter profundi TaxID=1622118 RepID=A0A120IDV9_9FLAO|nr:endolytic transglycosylase MltG [Lutibacter profundi]AMC09747.1 aminodeoxychorismate lyase [Lutibacter profundi]